MFGFLVTCYIWCTMVSLEAIHENSLNLDCDDDIFGHSTSFACGVLRNNLHAFSKLLQGVLHSLTSN